MEPIRVLLVDDQVRVCECMAAMLNLEADLEVVGIAENGRVAIERVSQLYPDVVLMDIQMPLMDGRTATRLITQSFPGIKVLVLSTFDEAQLVADAVKAGANGYLLKTTNPVEIAQTIRQVYRGFAQFGPNLLGKCIGELESRASELLLTAASREPIDPDLQDKVMQLTPREREVLALLGLGEKNREIAEKLDLSESTVKTYVSRLLAIFEQGSRAKLAILANSFFSTHPNSP